MKEFFKYILLSIVLTLAGCQNKTKAPKVKEAKPVVTKIQEVSPKISDIDTAFKVEISGVYNAYNQLKEALVASDSALAKTSAILVLSKLNNVEMSLLKKLESHKVWMTEKPLLTAYLNSLLQSKTLAKQRMAFLQISTSMIKLVENFGVSQKVMVQFCPMADDFKGGFWLSTDAAIKNPYYGSKMLTCGSTKRIIK